MPNIKSAEFVKSSANVQDCPNAQLPEYAFIGRSNVGKSSLINLLTGRNKLAKISSRPGKTQLINHFLIDGGWFLVDLPGYGWAKVSKSDKEKWKLMVNEYLQMREQLVCVFVLVDSRLVPQPIDMEFMRWLGEQEIPFTIIFTKTDKLGKTQVQKNIAAYKRAMLNDWEEMPKYFVTSAVSKLGGPAVVDYIHQLNATH